MSSWQILKSCWIAIIFHRQINTSDEPPYRFHFAFTSKFWQINIPSNMDYQVTQPGTYQAIPKDTVTGHEKGLLSAGYNIQPKYFQPLQSTIWARQDCVWTSVCQAHVPSMCYIVLTGLQSPLYHYKHDIQAWVMSHNFKWQHLISRLQSLGKFAGYWVSTTAQSSWEQLSHKVLVPAYGT